jgi:hypothetical protein
MATSVAVGFGVDVGVLGMRVAVDGVGMVVSVDVGGRGDGGRLVFVKTGGGDGGAVVGVSAAEGDVLHAEMQIQNRQMSVITALRWGILIIPDSLLV